MASSTETMTYQDNLNAQYLSSSLSSLSSSRSNNTLIVRTYKQATQQYLTKQFKGALETLDAIILPQEANGADGWNGDSNGAANGAESGPAMIAQSSRGTRTKVWVFYLSLLHAIVEMGQEEGKLVFGSATWRQLAAKVRDGTVWDEVVQRGYGGNEGEVDADVVVNLATLLLGHMQDQRLNQQRLESYLATSDNGGTNGHLSFGQDGVSTPMSASSSTPKQLASRMKILELYSLHVLPANGEWDYAQQFIELNDTLDEERKEAFQAALQTLKEEKDGTAQRERDLKEQRDREIEEEKRQEEARQAEAARQAEEEKRAAAEAASKPKPTPTAKATANGNASSSKPTPTPRPTASSHQSSSRPPQKKPAPRPSPPPTLYRRASSALGNLQHLVRNMANGQNSMALLRFLMFIIAFLVVITRRDLRMKLRRGIEGGWTKVKRTVGMGVKVSYCTPRPPMSVDRENEPVSIGRNGKNKRRAEILCRTKYLGITESSLGFAFQNGVFREYLDSHHICG
ncbi:uncharacterized protein LTR77_001832 [Saxophila tyrrhenica]|uniref:Peroxin 26 n=1 Tax=Saxophila tyrrhenica TaxID=1690608 RepID=A0AAV9PMM5_9PEZI|nr:hypothetical protein LTR77_001832 [Saxophila tyrrhenica]